MNYLFQKYVTKGVNLTDEYFDDRLGHAAVHFSNFVKHKQRIPEQTLEIGTGWYPVIPISFFLCGVDRVYSVDISFLTSVARIKTTLEKFFEQRKSGKLDTVLPNILPQRWAAIETLYGHIDQMNLPDVLLALRLHYVIQDARHLDFASDSIDLVNSNNTFEHIDAAILPGILKEFKRIVKKDGIMSHAIDMSDHFAHFDRNISIYKARMACSWWRISCAITN